MTAREILATFDLNTIPTLDIAVLGALDLFSHEALPQLPLDAARILVLGSGNASVSGKIIFSHADTTFADESSYQAALDNDDAFDAVVIISASGGKHAIPMTTAARTLGVPVYLITCNREAAAAELLPPEHVFTYPKNREPYTYNASTYLGPILAHTGEDPQKIANFIAGRVAPQLLRNFDDYRAVTFIIPAAFAHLAPMVRTKFDELFGPALVGRIFTDEEIKHAKTVVVSGEELFIALGVENTFYGVVKNRLAIPLPPQANYATLIAIAYFIVGKIQTAHPPHFAQNIEQYCKTASTIFGETINPIVE